MNSKEYKRIFPNVTLRTDNQAAGRWETNHGGEYFAAGVGGAITGRGADLLIIDDPHSEQDALSSDCNGQCLRMVHLRSSTASPTWWINSNCDDQMVSTKT